MLNRVITYRKLNLRDIFKVNRAYDVGSNYICTAEDRLDSLRNFFETLQREKMEYDEIQYDVIKHSWPSNVIIYLVMEVGNLTIIQYQGNLLILYQLILIKLYLIVLKVEKDSLYKGYPSRFFERLIFVTDDFDKKVHFKMFNKGFEEILWSFVNGIDFIPVNKSQENLKSDFVTISDFFENYFHSVNEPERYDLTKLAYYSTYILHKMLFVEIKDQYLKEMPDSLFIDKI